MKSTLACIAILFATWEIAARFAGNPALPPASDVAVFALSRETFDLWRHLGASLLRLVVGSSIGMAIGAAVGMASGYRQSVDRLLAPWLFLTHPFPKVTLVPIMILLFGVGELSKLLLVAIIVGYQTAFQIRDRIRSIPANYGRLLQSLQFSETRIVIDLLVPYSWPALTTSAKISLGSATAVLFFTETYATHTGMGYYIWSGLSRFDYLQVYLGSTVFCSVGLVIYLGLERLERRVGFWETELQTHGP